MTAAATPVIVPIDALDDAAVASSACRRLARDVGMDDQRSAQFAIVVSEMATNVARHGGGGRIELRADGDFLEARALDRGPGMRQPQTLLQDKPSTLWAPHQSLGAGGPAIARLSDEVLVVNRDGGGLEVVARKRRFAPDGVR